METAEHVFIESAVNHRAEQSVCTSLDENDVTHSVLLGMSEKEVPLFLNFNGTLLSNNF